LALLALDIFLGTAIPVARAAQSDRLISIADMAVCTASGMAAAPTRADEGGTPRTGESSAFCSACLPLVQLLASPEAPALRQPARIQGFVVALPALPWQAKTNGQGFSARAPPFSV
jgi:hypothetical protein